MVGFLELCTCIWLGYLQYVNLLKLPFPITTIYVHCLKATSLLRSLSNIIVGLLPPFLWFGSYPILIVISCQKFDSMPRYSLSLCLLHHSRLVLLILHEKYVSLLHNFGCKLFRLLTFFFFTNVGSNAIQFQFLLEMKVEWSIELLGYLLEEDTILSHLLLVWTRTRRSSQLLSQGLNEYCNKS